MGISERLKQKNAAILADAMALKRAPDDKSTQHANANEIKHGGPAAAGSPMTAPGGMAVFRQHLLKHESTVQSLESELKQYREGIRTLKLPTSTISLSRWANRHESSLRNSAFEALKDEIAHAGGNIQPILVRPASKGPDCYELVFGHRRFAACAELGLPVLSMVMDLSDEELFTLMDRENRQRADLTPYEQGVMWGKALDAGLFSSARQLAAHLGISHTQVNRCLDIAHLPDYVVQVFETPTELQHRWVKPIKDLMQSDPELLVERAQKIKALGKSLPAAKAFEMLTRTQTDEPKAPTISLKRDGKVIGKISQGLDGEVSLSIRPGIMTQAAFAKLQEQVEKLIGN